jgi:hypothetical protein
LYKLLACKRGGEVEYRKENANDIKEARGWISTKEGRLKEKDMEK